MSRTDSDFEYVEIDGETWEMVSEYIGTDDHASIEEWIVKALVTLVEEYNIMAEDTPLPVEEE